MDVTTQHCQQPLRLAHCCKSYGELRKLSLARRSARNCRAGPEFSWAVPLRPSSLSVRSCSLHRHSIELPSRSSLSDTHKNEGIAAAACPSNGSDEGASEGALTSNKANEAILAGANASENPKASNRCIAQASEPPNEGIPESTHLAEGSSPHNEGLLAAPNASEKPKAALPPSPNLSEARSTQIDGVPSAFKASERQHNGLTGAKEEADLVHSLWIENIPPRYKLILSTSLAFVICNMDKVNLSVAIIPMSKQLHWNASTAGLVQSSFFWGYTLSQLPGGWLAKWFTGEAVLGAGVFIWSVATAAVPIAASFIPALLLSRLFVGLGEGVSPSAATDLIARNVPATERSRAVAFVFNGLNVGSVTGLVLAPVIIERFGWESVFYIFAVLGIVWSCLEIP